MLAGEKTDKRDRHTFVLDKIDLFAVPVNQFNFESRT
jgi:hypothetical protein